jgi:hypothetical protein
LIGALGGQFCSEIGGTPPDGSALAEAVAVAEAVALDVAVADPGWKNEEGKSRRTLHLCFRDGVGGVVGVDPEGV